MGRRSNLNRGRGGEDPGAGDVTTYDVVIIGAGPAGLSAAFMLGRCRRRVVVIDDGAPRNRAAQASHGFFTRDSSAPPRLLALGRAQLATYPTVELLAGTVVTAEGSRGSFDVRCSDGLGSALGAKRFGVDGSVESRIVCVDQHRQWSQAKNLWQNAAIRSTLYSFVRPFRRR